MGNQDKNQGQMGQTKTGETQMDQRKPGWNKDQDDWNKDKGQSQSQHDWQGQGNDDMEQGKATDPAQPSGTTPLERDQRPINQSR